MLTSLLLLTIAACDTCPEADTAAPGDDTAEAADSNDTADLPDDDLNEEETDALCTWTARSVSIQLTGAQRSIEGDEIRLLIADSRLAELDVATALTRAQDHNSSRCNKTAPAWVSDGLGSGALEKVPTVSCRSVGMAASRAPYSPAPRVGVPTVPRAASRSTPAPRSAMGSCP